MAAPATAKSNLPHWDMSVVYPGLDSPEFEQAFRSTEEGIGELEQLFDRYDIRKRDKTPVEDEMVKAFEEVVGKYNQVLDARQTIAVYINCFVATDSRNNLAQARLSESQKGGVRLAKLSTRFSAWLGSLDVEQLIERSQAARDHAFMVRKAAVRATHLMSPPEEDLAADMKLTGSIAWGKLHSNLTSQLMVPVEVKGEKQELPMSMVRNLGWDPDREVRRSAYEAELQAWQKAALPLAAALNSIKGEVNTLSKRRGWPSALDEALFDSNIDRQTLDAMMQAAHESFPDFRRYLRAKARALGIDKLAWYDITAPVSADERVWEWADATRFVEEQFGSYSPKMRDFAARAFREGWVDAEPRGGKRDGAFCSPLRADQSRVFLNFKTSFGSVSTLAHELGHGYHNMVKSGRTALQKTTPMTLAETASIFCETIIEHAAMRDASKEEQIALLESALERNCQVVVDITSRFLFEKGVFEKRLQRELSVDELNELMLQAQRDTYGDALDQSKLHPYMWAVKPHYYRNDLSFYNYPYMFGLLFGLGLYARYRQDPEAFKAGYDDLLSSTGLADAATLAARFGIDTRTPDFWRSSLDIVRADIDRFDKLV